jgi:hypothetical protein
MKTRQISIEAFKKGRLSSEQKEEARERVIYYIKEIDKKGARPAVTIYKGKVLDGNHRLKAYTILKHKFIPCVFLSIKDLNGYLFPRNFKKARR